MLSSQNLSFFLNDFFNNHFQAILSNFVEMIRFCRYWPNFFIGTYLSIWGVRDFFFFCFGRRNVFSTFLFCDVDRKKEKSMYWEAGELTVSSWIWTWLYMLSSSWCISLAFHTTLISGRRLEGNVYFYTKKLGFLLPTMNWKFLFSFLLAKELYFSCI
jgi:hypothetical protein